MSFIILTCYDEYPKTRSGQRLVNTIWIKDAVQEYRLEQGDGNVHLVPPEVPGSIPVVHIWLQYSVLLQNLKSSSDQKIDNSKIEQYPKDRPSELWVDGWLDEIFHELEPGVPDQQVLEDMLRIRVGITKDSEDNILIPVGATEVVLTIPGLIAGGAWVVLDGNIMPLRGEVEDDPDGEDGINYWIVYGTDEMTLTFYDTGGEGFALKQRVYINYKYYAAPEEEP